MNHEGLIFTDRNRDHVYECETCKFRRVLGPIFTFKDVYAVEMAHREEIENA